MRKYEMKVEMVDKKRLVDIVCDKCGKSFEHDHALDGSPGAYDLNEFKLEWRSGSRYPEGGSGEETLVDLCSGCRKWLSDLLTREGVNLRVTDWDY